MEILKATNIIKNYTDGTEKLEVLTGVSITVLENDLVAVTGESGSGKSTLLNILGLLDQPDSGDIKFYDRTIDFKTKTLHEFRNQKIGFVLQSHFLLDDFTVMENVAMPMFIKTTDLKKSLAEAENILIKIGLKNRMKFYPNQLSGGEQQRVSIARALINKPDIIMADEPTGNLDQKNSNIIVDLLIELNNSTGTAILMATHNLEIVKRMTRHFVINNGKLIPN